MGADSGMLSRQFLTEGVLLSLFGAALGLFPAAGGPRLIVRLNAGSIPRAAETGVDRRVLLFTLCVSSAAGVFFWPGAAAASLWEDRRRISESRRRTCAGPGSVDRRPQAAGFGNVTQPVAGGDH
ncbi:MAG: hypothetical protein LC126_23250 [Bryobacterales bacterium]|nr:hypothetical protein [Bryobacterales bacterium]